MTSGEDTPKILLKLALKIARVRAKKTAQQAAEAVGKSRQAVSAWERLEESAPLPDESDLETLCAFYGLSVEELKSAAGVVSYAPGETIQRVAELAPDAGDWVTTPLPRHLRNLPLRVREYLAEFRLRLTKGGATEEEIEEALDLLRSPQVFTFYKGGAPSEYGEEDVLRGMRALGEGVVIPELRDRGRKL